MNGSLYSNYLLTPTTVIIRQIAVQYQRRFSLLECSYFQVFAVGRDRDHSVITRCKNLRAGDLPTLNDIGVRVAEWR
jgi:hypothetical protein